MDNDTSMQLQLLYQTIFDLRTCNIVIVAFLALAAYDMVICFSDEVSAISTVIHIATNDVFEISVVLYGMHNGRRETKQLFHLQLWLGLIGAFCPECLMALRTYALYSGSVFGKWCIISLLVAELVSLLGLFILITAKVACGFIWASSGVGYHAARSNTFGNDNFEPVLDFRASSPYLTYREQGR
ncbi:hypothetical protein A7U60_g2023 [Sanghuangporus baumii]|uniref:Transmembrane protein n=1 Tax=Sanghuangporus baumii TaxID=108892 RepID=A0A9Q5NE79_SANBA|nr:hypothetical protein A7U60_g2023 [Sanghuangporus baumii]